MPPLRQTITSTSASTKKFRTKQSNGWLIPAVFVATPMTEMKNIANTMSKIPWLLGSCLCRARIEAHSCASLSFRFPMQNIETARDDQRAAAEDECVRYIAPNDIAKHNGPKNA